MSAEALAKSVGLVAATSIYDYEKDKAKPSLDTLLNISKLFDVNLDSLVFRDLSKGGKASSIVDEGQVNKLIDEVESLRSENIKLQSKVSELSLELIDYMKAAKSKKTIKK